jgi:hypothetical protein
MKMNSNMPRLGRRDLGIGLLAAVGLVVAGCGGGGGNDDGGQLLYSAFNRLTGNMREADVKKLVDGSPAETDAPRSLEWTSEKDRLEVRFSGGYVSSATWTDLVTGQRLVRNFKGGSIGGAGDTGSLYQSYLALRPGMTKSEVIAMVRVAVSQGAGSSQVLWIDGEEALGVRFNGTANSSTVTFAQWGLSIAAGSRSETRTL